MHLIIKPAEPLLTHTCNAIKKKLLEVARSICHLKERLLQVSLDSPHDIDLFNAPYWAPNNDDADALIDYIERLLRIRHHVMSPFIMQAISA